MLMTMIARISDGMPLSASIQEDEQSGRNIMDYQSQAKQLFRQMSKNPPTRLSIETGPYLFHCLVESGVCYLVLAEKSFSKKLAYAYLEDLETEFREQYGHKYQTASRPYSFIEFDTYIQKAKRTYMDSRARRQLGSINTELQEVHTIMLDNIQEVLQRGESLGDLDRKAQHLSGMSDKYRKDARYLNLRSSTMKVIAVCIILVLFFLFLRYVLF